MTEKKKADFQKLKRLRKFLDNEGLEVSGCGCCKSPWIEVFSDEAGEASRYYDWPVKDLPND